MEIKDATEDGWIMLSNMLLIKVSIKNQLTHMLEFKEHAKKMKDHSKLNLLLMYLQEIVMFYNKDYKLNQFQLPLMPIIGSSMEEEYSATVDPI